MRHAHPEKSFNVSRWALEHDALTRFLMIVLMLLGVAAYFQLGQDEDPPFTFRAMVVRTYWPGATAQQVAEQVTDKLERTLQEAPFADKIRSYSKPGESQIIFQIKDSSKAADVPNVWYSVRKKIGDMKGTLPQGVIGPFFNDEFGDVYGVIYALEADGFNYAELKTFADEVRQELLRVPDVAKVELFGAQDEKLYIEISQKRLAQLGLDMNAVLAQLGQQNAVEAAGAVQTPLDVVQVRVGGPVQCSRRSQSHADPWRLGQPAAPVGHRGHPPRLYRSAGDQGAPPGQGSDCAGGVNGQRWRHHCAGQVPAGGHRSL
jgi:multidrug efflux pump